LPINPKPAQLREKFALHVPRSKELAFRRFFPYAEQCENTSLATVRPAFAGQKLARARRLSAKSFIERAISSKTSFPPHGRVYVDEPKLYRSSREEKSPEIAA